MLRGKANVRLSYFTNSYIEGLAFVGDGAIQTDT